MVAFGMRRVGATALLMVLSTAPAAAQFASASGNWICLQPSPYGAGQCVSEFTLGYGGFVSSQSVCDGGVSSSLSGQWSESGAILQIAMSGQACDSNGYCIPRNTYTGPQFFTLSGAGESRSLSFAAATCITTSSSSPFTLEQFHHAMHPLKDLIRDKIDDMKKDFRSGRWRAILDRFGQFVRRAR